MDRPCISIIIPTYRCAGELPALLACLKAQTFGFGRLEVLFADDASPDGTGAAIDALAAQHENIRALHLPENTGFGGAPRNAALRAAGAPYLMFLDADDRLPETACALLYSEMLRTNADLVTGYCRRVARDGAVLAGIPAAYAEIPAHTSALPGELPRELVMRDAFFARLYKRDIVAAHGLFFPERTPGEDIFFLYSYLLRCQKAVYIAQPVYDYVVNEASVTQNKTARYYARLGELYRQMRGLFADAGREDCFPIVIENILEEHLRGMAASERISQKELADTLPAWEWLLLFEAAADRLGDQPLAEAVLPLAQEKRWEEAARFLRLSLPLCAALDRARAETREWRAHALEFQRSVTEMRSSRSWRLTHPFAKP